MQQHSLRVALIGCGRIGAFTRPELRRTLPPGWLPLNHAEAILANRELNLDSVCDVNPESLKRACRTFGVPGYADYSRQISDTRPDLVSIATRTNVRGNIARYVLQHGVRGIHCEKPISTSMGDCRRMLSAIVRQDVKLTYGTTRRFMDVYRLARDMLDAGEIGNLIGIEIQYGRSPLLWTHPHSADLLLFFTEGRKIRHVRAHCRFQDVPNGALLIDDDPIVEDAVVEFNDGTIGRISAKEGLHVVLTGASGTLQICQDGRWLEVQKGTTAVQRIEPTPIMSGTARAFHELESSVRYNGKTSISAHDIEMGLAILLSIAKSALKDGAPICPESLEDSFTVTGRIGDKYA
jgi:scyllo-inositol 2-dehydrogenase (NAD+)